MQTETTQQAGAASGASSGKTEAQAPLTDRLRSFVEEQMAGGSAEESAAPEDDSTETEAPEEDAAGEEEGTAGESSENEGEEEPKMYTAAEIRGFIKENPRWQDTLDREGWKRVPEDIAEILKEKDREIQRREMRLAEKEREKPAASTEKAQPSISLEEISDMLVDPETAPAGVVQLVKMALPELLDELGIKTSTLKKVASEASANEVFDAAWADAIDEVPAMREFGDAEHARLQKIIAADPDMLSELQSHNSVRIAKVLRKAGRIYLDERARAADEDAKRKQREAATAKQKQISVKAKANRDARSASSIVTAPAGALVRAEGETPLDFIRRQLRETQTRK